MTNITACGLDPAGSQRKDTHPEQWLSGLGGLKRLADCRVGGQRSVLNDSGHNAVDLSPCNKHTWSGIAGSLTITSAQTPSQLHRAFAEDYAAQRVPYWQSYSGFGMLSMISRDVQWPRYSIAYPLVHWCIICKAIQSRTCRCSAVAGVAVGCISPKRPAQGSCRHPE